MFVVSWNANKTKRAPKFHIYWMAKAKWQRGDKDFVEETEIDSLEVVGTRHLHRRFVSIKARSPHCLDEPGNPGLVM